MKSGRVRTVELKPSQIEQAGQLLAKAFYNDPLFTYTAPQAELRSQILPDIQIPMVRYGLIYGKVYTTPDLEAVAVWFPPGETEMKLWRMYRTGMFTIPFKMPINTLLRLVSIEKPAEVIRKKAVTGEYWYLAVLGVDPVHQGKGLGGAILEPVLTRADSANLPCYLETMKDTNVAFYEKIGFAVAGECEVQSKGSRKDSVRIWGMVRQPLEGKIETTARGNDD
jgi:ribosomal protein S18 acetylase RimI-like enzyme